MKSVNATHYELIPTYPSKKSRKEHVVHAVIETPKGSCLKFALEAKLGIIALRMVLPKGYTWPYDYGFIPQTLGDDGDPLDILVMLDVPTFSGCMIPARLLGAIRLRKNGVENDRVIAAPLRMDGVKLPTDGYETLSDIGGSERRDLEAFLRGYSADEGNEIEIVAAIEVDAAAKLIEKGRKAFARSQ